jgi:hypothetical protein
VIDNFYLGPVPAEEDCAQVGDPDYNMKATREMNAYIGQLQREFSDYADYGLFRIKWQNHDFGRYGDVVFVFDDETEGALDYAIKVENNTPMNWDDMALLYLKDGAE